jgi:hypothetical protein
VYDFDLPQLQPVTWADAPHAVSELAAVIFAQAPAPPARSAGDVAAEALYGQPAGESTSGSRSGRRFTAQVGRADVLTADGRAVFTRDAWAAAVEAANLACRAGVLGGSVDVPGSLDGGNTKSRALLWHALELRADGTVWGDFTIVATAAGRNLLAWTDKGGALSFTPTIGAARTREATAADLRRLGLPAGTDAVVVDAFRLISLDSTTSPWMAGASLPGVRPD